MGAAVVREGAASLRRRPQLGRRRRKESSPCAGAWAASGSRVASRLLLHRRGRHRAVDAGGRSAARLRRVGPAPPPRRSPPSCRLEGGVLHARAASGLCLHRGGRRRADDAGGRSAERLRRVAPLVAVLRLLVESDVWSGSPGRPRLFPLLLLQRVVRGRLPVSRPRRTCACAPSVAAPRHSGSRATGRPVSSPQSPRPSSRLKGGAPRCRSVRSVRHGTGPSVGPVPPSQSPRPSSQGGTQRCRLPRHDAWGANRHPESSGRPRPSLPMLLQRGGRHSTAER